MSLQDPNLCFGGNLILVAIDKSTKMPKVSVEATCSYKRSLYYF